MATPEETRQQRDFKRKSAVARQVYPILAGTLAFILVLGTVVYHYVEGWSWVDAFYFSAVAGSTVGFGDLSPTTNGSKLFTVLYIFSAMAIITTFLDQRLKYHGVVLRRAKREVNIPTDGATNADS